MTAPSILQGVSWETTSRTPYLHGTVNRCLSPSHYHLLALGRPTVAEVLHGRPTGSNARYDLNAHEALALPSLDHLWREFVLYHTSIFFWRELVALFGNDFSRVYPRLTSGWMHKAKVGVRGLDKGCDVYLDCNIGINTPNENVSRVRGPHIDNPVELWAAMLYMRAPGDDSTGGDFIIYQLDREFRFHGKAEVPDEDVTEFELVPYEANRMVYLMNSLDAVHGVTPRDATPHPRLLVNIIVELGEPLFKYKHLRRKAGE